MSMHRKTAIRTALLSLVGNGFLAVAKALTGILGNSAALIADAIESLNDMLASLLVVFGMRYATMPADDNHPYGHGKAEPLVTFLVVAILVASAVVIAWQSISNLSQPREAPEAYTLLVLLAIIIIKEVMYRLVSKAGEHTGSSALQADAWHHRSDAITSAVAFFGIGITLLMGEGWEHADDWAALLACAFILYNAYRIFRPALGEVMDEHSHPIMEHEVRRLSANTHGVQGTEKCFVRKTGLNYHIDLHLQVEGSLTVQQGHEIAHAVKDNIRQTLPNVADVHIHVEPFAHQ
jgi:cation diffusion facilitator family transporter